MSKKRRKKAIDLRERRDELEAATDVIGEALQGPDEDPVTHPAIDVVERRNEDGTAVRIRVQTRNPYSYKKAVRRFLSEHGQPIPDHLKDDGGDGSGD